MCSLEATILDRAKSAYPGWRALSSDIQRASSGFNARCSSFASRQLSQLSKVYLKLLRTGQCAPRAKAFFTLLLILRRFAPSAPKNSPCFQWCQSCKMRDGWICTSKVTSILPNLKHAFPCEALCLLAVGIRDVHPSGSKGIRSFFEFE